MTPRLAWLPGRCQGMLSSTPLPRKLSLKGNSFQCKACGKPKSRLFEKRSLSAGPRLDNRGEETMSCECGWCKTKRQADQMIPTRLTVYLKSHPVSCFSER